MAIIATAPSPRRWSLEPLAHTPLAITLVCAVIVGGWGSQLPDWGVMWLLALAVYASLKWLTFAEFVAQHKAMPLNWWGYLLLWPGMNAFTFFELTTPRKIGPVVWTLIAAKLGFGGWLFFFAAPSLLARSPLWAAWIALGGLYFLLHSGSFHLLALFWQTRGRAVEPLMDWPVAARSIGEYWGRRWNTAFRDLAQHYLFRPFVRSSGPALATLVVFLVSGVIHDLVISLPARGGWGLPTLYFLLQGVALLVERGRWGKRWGLGQGARGRCFAWVIIVGPAPLLFHGPFLDRVVAPMVEAVGNL